MNGKRNRTKGHDLERDCASLFRNLGFSFAKTTRAESKTLDDAGVDIANIPFLVQCKAGYDDRYPRFPEIYKGIRENIKKAYPKDSPLQELPVILIHKPNRNAPYWSIDQAFALELFKKATVNADIIATAIDVLTKAKQEILALEEALQQSNEKVEEYTIYDDVEDDDNIIHSTPIFNETYDQIVALLDTLKII